MLLQPGGFSVGFRLFLWLRFRHPINPVPLPLERIGRQTPPPPPLALIHPPPLTFHAALPHPSQRLVNAPLSPLSKRPDHQTPPSLTTRQTTQHIPRPYLYQ